MSYSFTVPTGPGADFTDAATKAADSYKAGLASNDVELDPAAVESIDAAVAAAKSIVDSGAVGAGLVSAVFSGHANPGHKPTKGWANDCVTVSIYCQDPQPTA